MPRGDGTGPQGKGSGTGRRMGTCGLSRQQSSNQKTGQEAGKSNLRGQGKGLGQGRGQGQAGRAGQQGRGGRGRSQ